ncbi:hypothetical protein GWK47_032917 [Chionoecetes opilio]|uniref:Uncharacterized protein n=1 Tax=Chionoecetes opilio TaxID=41210 RepID=A0A8J5D478_CHIOP|nr:hypothetical protein GWK47_032917 [Chionoecetes opilio]
MKRQSQVTRLGGAYLNAPEGSPSIPKTSLEVLQYPSHFLVVHAAETLQRHTTHPTTQGIFTLLVPHTAENALEMVPPPHGGDALLPHSVISTLWGSVCEPRPRGPQREPPPPFHSRKGSRAATRAPHEQTHSSRYLPPFFFPAKTKHSLASTHHALYQRLVEGFDVVMVPTVQKCILEATNPDRIYGNAPQQLCHYTGHTPLSSACPPKSHLFLAALSCLTCVRAGSPLTLKSSKKGKWSEETLLYRMEHSSITLNRHGDNST